MIMNRIVLMSDGGIEALVTASLILQDLDKDKSSSTVLCTLGCTINHPAEPFQLTASRMDCIEAQASLIDSETVEVMSSDSSLLSVLARAIEMAGEQGAVYWPIRCGQDPVFLQRTMDTMLGVVHLNTQITGSSGPELILPLIDLDPDQVAEMACELDAPIQSGWPCSASSLTPCGGCESCQAWTLALKGCGLITSSVPNSP